MYNSVQYINQTYYSVFTGYRTRPLDKYIYIYIYIPYCAASAPSAAKYWMISPTLETRTPKLPNQPIASQSANPGTFFHGPIHWMRGCHPCLPPRVGCGFPQTVDIRLDHGLGTSSAGRLAGYGAYQDVFLERSCSMTGCHFSG